MRRRNDFIERSVSGILAFFRESVLSEEYASRKGLMQSLDPRVKVVTLAVWLTCVMLLRDAGHVLALYPVCLCLAAFSRIPPAFFLKRTLIFIPLFSLLIAFPSIFSAFTPGEPLWILHAGGMTLTVTRPGFEGALLFVSRVLVSVSLAVLVTLTTRSFELFAGLRCLGVPQVFVMTLDMCHRYIFLFAGIVQDMFLGIKSRTGGRLAHGKGRRIVAWNIAVLWHRSVRTNREVYNAMLSRGYTGEARPLRNFCLEIRDLVWITFSLVACAAALAAGRIL